MNESTVFDIGLTIDHIRHLRDANEGSVSEVGKSIFAIMEARCNAYDLLEELDKERQVAREAEVAEAEAVELLSRGAAPGVPCYMMGAYLVSGDELKAPHTDDEAKELNPNLTIDHGTVHAAITEDSVPAEEQEVLNTHLVGIRK